MSRVKILTIMMMVCGSVLFSGCAQLTVTGLTQGERDGQTVTVDSRQIKRGKVDTVNRVQRFQGQPYFDSVNNLAMQLKVVEQGNPPAFAEDYYFLSMSSPKEEISGGTAEDLNYVPNHLGKMTFLKIDQSGTSVEAVPQQGEGHVGAAWLARVEDDDRKIPWQIGEGSNCISLGDGDCFDMESLSRLLFDALTGPVEDGVRANVPLVQNIHHRLHFVPQVEHSGIGPNNRPAKGFGFIYFAQINLPGANFQVYVPINFLFVDNIDGYILLIDPLELDEEDQQTSGQVYVKENLLGGIDINLTEGLIRDKVIEAIAGAELPVLFGGVEFSEAMLFAINGAAGSSGTISSDYNFFLTPSGDNRDLAQTILWDQPVVGGVMNFNQVDLYILE